MQSQSTPQPTSTESQWANRLREYPPLLTPNEVRHASCGIIKPDDIYRRNQARAKRLNLDYYRIGGKVYVTKISLIKVLSGNTELPL
jgi:hypothetical protein